MGGGIGLLSYKPGSVAVGRKCVGDGGGELPSTIPNPDRRIGTMDILLGESVSTAYSYPMGDVSCSTTRRAIGQLECL